MTASFRLGGARHRQKTNKGEMVTKTAFITLRMCESGLRCCNAVTRSPMTLKDTELTFCTERVYSESNSAVASAPSRRTISDKEVLISKLGGMALFANRVSC